LLLGMQWMSTSRDSRICVIRVEPALVNIDDCQFFGYVKAALEWYFIKNEGGVDVQTYYQRLHTLAKPNPLAGTALAITAKSGVYEREGGFWSGMLATRRARWSISRLNWSKSREFSSVGVSWYRCAEIK
jgi:hypothetical protein